MHVTSGTGLVWSMLGKSPISIEADNEGEDGDPCPAFPDSRSDLFADLGHNMANAIGLQLLREWALLLNIPPLAVTEGLVDFGAFQLVPREGGIRIAAGEEEAIHFVDLGEMDCGRRPLLLSDVNPWLRAD